MMVKEGPIILVLQAAASHNPLMVARPQNDILYEARKLPAIMSWRNRPEAVVAQ